MFKPVSALMISALLLGGCVGQDEGAPVSSETGENNPLIPQRSAAASFFSSKEDAYKGTPVGMITDLLLERRPGGYIVRVTGLADFPGPFDVRLEPVEGSEDTGTLAFRLLALQVRAPGATSEAARTVTVAKWMSDKELAPYRALRVEGLRNAQSVSR